MAGGATDTIPERERSPPGLCPGFEPPGRPAELCQSDSAEFEACKGIAVMTNHAKPLLDLGPFKGVTPSECYIPDWLPVDKWGYPRISEGARGKYQRAHRAVYRLFCGPLKKGEWVLHSCGNAGCINPHHLRIGTPQENQDDAKLHGTTAREFRIHNTKLSDEQVREIRASSLRNYELCKIYGVSKSVISQIRSGKARRSAYAKECSQ